jgi:hypothetical protein
VFPWEVELAAEPALQPEQASGPAAVLKRAHELAAEPALELERAWGRAVELEQAGDRAGEPVVMWVGRGALEGQ